MSALKKKKKDFFLYLHYLDPHNPYKPPPGYKNLLTGKLKVGQYTKQLQSIINRYDAEIKYLDDQLAKLFERLKKDGFWDNSIIIIVADHGEQFEEHGNHGHGYQLYNEELHVPLMIKFPGRSKPEAADRRPGSRRSGGTGGGSAGA